MSIQPSPCFAALDRPDCAARYIQGSRDRRASLARTQPKPNLSDLRDRQAIVPTRLAPWRAARSVMSGVAAFRNHVSMIVTERPQEQMRRPHTRRIVTVVKNVQTIGDWAVRERPGDTTGRMRAPFVDERTVGWLSPKVDVAGRHPKPAVARSVDLFPEPFARIASHRSCSFGAKAPDVYASRGHLSRSIISARSA